MMVLELPRQGGKSTACLKWLREHIEDGVLLVTSEEEARRLRGEAMRTFGHELVKGYNSAFWEHRIVAWGRRDFVLQGRGRKQVYIDQADHILRGLLPAHAELKGITLDA